MSNTYTVKTEFRALDRMTSVMSRISSKTKEMGSSMARSVKQADKAISDIQGELSGLATGAVAAGAGVGLAAAVVGKKGAEFEQVLANIKAVAAPTNEELDRLGSTALQVGADMGFSGTEVATAMEAMAKQGLSVQQVLDGIGGVAAAAAADGSTLEETMVGLLATMTGMGKGAGDLQHIADVMAKAGDSTAASIGSLSQSMAVFGPTARGLNIPLESAIGQLAILQDAGIEASSAGTALSAVYSKLAAPMGRTKDALKELGIQVSDAMGNMKPPEQLMSEIMSATSKIQGNVGKAAAMTELVGLESQKALQNVTAAISSGKYDKVMKDLTANVDGYSKSVAATKMDTTTGDVKKLTASLEGLSVSLFSLESGPLRGAVQGMTELVAGNRDAIVRKVGDALKWVSDNGEALVNVLKAVAAIAVPILTLSIAIKAVAAATAILNAVMALNPVIMWIAGIGVAVALLWTFWPEISGFFKMVWDGIVSVASKIGGAILGVAQAIWGGITGFFMGAFNLIVGLLAFAIRPLWPYLLKYFGWLGTVAQGIATAWRAFASFFVALWDGIVSKIQQIGGVLAEVGAAIAEKFMAAWEGVKTFFSDLWGGIVSMFETYISPIIDKVAGFAGRVASFFGDAQDEGERVATGERSLVHPGERTAKQITESNSTTTQRTELNVKAPAGSTVRGARKGLTTLKLSPSGAP